MRNHCSYEATCKDGVLEIKLRGEIDHHSAVAVRTELDQQICEVHPKKTVIDLSAIDFMDSSGLGLIMGRYSLMQKLGGELTLRDPAPNLCKIFALAGLGRMVRIETGARAEEENKEEET